MTDSKIVQMYKDIYANPELFYGGGMHGRKKIPDIIEYVDSKNVLILDVGCGNNQLVQSLRLKGYNAIGVDIASPLADKLMDADALDFTDKSVDLLTAFDVLEHIKESDLDAVFTEFQRVAHKFMFTIATVPEVRKKLNYVLHVTIHPFLWWVKTINQFGTVRVQQGKFFMGTFNDTYSATKTP